MAYNPHATPRLPSFSRLPPQCRWGSVYDPPVPLSLQFPPFIGVFFFYGNVIDEGVTYDPPVFFTPPEIGGFFFLVVNVLNKFQNIY